MVSAVFAMSAVKSFHSHQNTVTAPRAPGPKVWISSRRPGFKYLFTIIDRFSRWVEVVPVTDISADTCIQALMHGWISRYGVPGDIVADRGAQFTSSLWRRLSELFGIKCSNTTAYHPQANGMIERVHRQLKAALMAR